MEFRQDLNGLRAYAVVAVVLYHFGLPFAQGGFVGVDVFFVISGYLMTALILGQMHAGRFSLLSFYLARARRIVPALVVVCAALLAFGWFWLTPGDYTALARHAGSSVGFFSNMVYARESGYFDAGAHDKWLLHTWSLSVEWQFYCLYPVGLMLLRRLSLRPAVVAVALVAALLLSLALSVAWVGSQPIRAFFWLPSRAWEMLAGGCVYLLQPHLQWRSPLPARLLEGLGAALIVGSVLALDPGVPWPGSLAVLPVAGAVMVMLAQRQGSWLTGTRVAQHLGNASYSIYLWHWPVVVLLAYLDAEHQPVWVAAGLLASWLLGWASYRWVEQPVRQGMLRLPQWRAAGVHAAGAGAVAAMALLLMWQHGVPSRVPPDVTTAAAESRNMHPRWRECLRTGWPLEQVRGCAMGQAPSSGEAEVVLIGDSHAGALFGAMEAALQQSGRSGHFFGATSCPPIRGVQFDRGVESDCAGFYRNVHRWLDDRKTPVTVVLVGRWSNYLYDRAAQVRLDGHDGFGALPPEQREREYAERLVASVCEYARKGPLYLVGPIPEMGFNVPRTLARDRLREVRRTDYGVALDEHQRKNRVVARALEEAGRRCGARTVDPSRYLCEGGLCHAELQGRPLYFDDDHLSEYGNRFVLPALLQAVQPAAVGAP